MILNGRFLTQGLTGVQRFATEVTRALDAARAPVTLLAPPGAAGLDRFPHLAPRVVGRRSGQAWEQFDLPRAARGQFLINLGNTGPVLAGRRQIVVIHDAGVFDTPESYGRAFRLWYRTLHRRLARQGARIATVSRFSAGRIGAALGLDPAAIPVLPEGGEHILRDAAEPALLTQHGLVPGRYALAVGTGAAHKNLAALDAAVAVLEEAGMVLAVAGSKDPRVFRAEGTARPGLRGLGRVTDGGLRALYENAACLLFPSRYEGFGLPPVEAMWCGCPVIAARAGAVPEVCGEAALWFDPDSAPAAPDGMAAALRRLIAEDGLRDRLAAAGRARAAMWSWDRAAQRLLEGCA
ncbi:MAG: glycosyltransferase family 4 protein [Acetobacteraceae bacterium]|nr:glycosyltransferase family 4 protein [Acetobacteraceae bacterium]